MRLSRPTFYTVYVVYAAPWVLLGAVGPSLGIPGGPSGNILWDMTGVILGWVYVSAVTISGCDATPSSLGFFQSCLSVPGCFLRPSSLGFPQSCLSVHGWFLRPNLSTEPWPRIPEPERGAIGSPRPSNRRPQGEERRPASTKGSQPQGADADVIQRPASRSPQVGRQLQVSPR